MAQILNDGRDVFSAYNFNMAMSTKSMARIILSAESWALAASAPYVIENIYS